MADDHAPVSTTIEDGVAVLRFDDGKANVLSPTSIEALGTALDRAELEARSVCIVGRPGRFSAGFDLSIMTSGPDAARKLLAAGGELIMRVFMHPQPVVAAVTGHALAAGALLVLACDVRIAADLPTKIGLNETSIGMPLPLFARELAADRLDRRHLTQATLGARTYAPAEAAAIGYVDTVVPADTVEAEAIAEARRLGAYAPRPYAQTKHGLRQPIIDRVVTGGQADLQSFTVGPAS